MTLNLNQQQEFSPEIASRNTEYILWGAIGLFIGLALFIPGYLGKLTFWSWALLALFVLAAVSISLNNWNMRYTKILLSSKFIEHKSKLRQVSINWENIDRVLIRPGRLGDKIIVSSDKAAFFFETLGELKTKGVVKEKIGFAAGDQILKTILTHASFTKKNRIQETDHYYYSRN